MINIENLDFYYRKSRMVLQDITMNISSGRIVGLLGKNGVGKTTLLHLLAGLQFPIKGEISVFGFSPKDRRREYLQNLFLLGEEVPAFTMKISMFEKMNACFYPNFSHEKFIEYLNEFEIMDMEQRIDRLSFGTRKKVLIAFSLATGVNLTLLDEPTNGLDIPSKTVFRKILRTNMADNKLIIISTHQARDLQNILDAIIILDETKVLLNATEEEISKKLYFGIAKTNRDDANILYIEPSLVGNQIVRVNDKKEESNVDVELLFNAAFNRKNLFKQLFNN